MDFIKFSAYLIFAPAVLLTLAIIAGLFNLKKFSPIGKALLLYLGIMLFFDSLNIFLGYVLKMRNQVILPIYSLTELCFFMYFYSNFLFKKRHLLIKVLGFVSVGYIIVELLVDFVFNHISPKDFQPYAKVVDNFIIVLFALTFLSEKMSSYNESRWDNFRLNMVFLVFFTLNSLLFLPFNFLVNENSGVKFYFWAGNVLLLLAFYVYLIVRIWKGQLVTNK